MRFARGRLAAPLRHWPILQFVRENYRNQNAWELFLLYANRTEWEVTVRTAPQDKWFMAHRGGFLDEANARKSIVGYRDGHYVEVLMSKGHVDSRVSYLDLRAQFGGRAEQVKQKLGLKREPSLLELANDLPNSSQEHNLSALVREGVLEQDWRCLKDGAITEDSYVKKYLVPARLQLAAMLILESSLPTTQRVGVPVVAQPPRT